MNGTVIKAVAEFAEVITGGTPSTTKPEYWDGDVPWLNSGSLNEGVITAPSKFITKLGLANSSAKLMPKDTVLVALTGATTGQVGYLSIEASANQSVTGILPSKEHHPKYLYFYLKSQRQKMLGDAFGGAQPHINQKYVKDFKIPLPPLDDQIRIAHLLGKVEGLVAQRKQHLQQLDDLLKSVFLEMFGDPVRNEKGWDVQPCEKAVLDISSGTSYGGEDRAFLSPDEVGVLKISAVTKGTFDPTEFKVVDPTQITKALRFVKRGDFLFSRANTVELVAACCIVPQDYNQLFLPDKLWVMTLNQELINPIFFNLLLKNKRYRDVVRNLASGGHDSMLNISMKKFMTLDVPCPPVEMQSQFAVIVEKVEGIKSRYQQGLTDLEALYGALSQQAFKGELDLSRVPLPGIQAEKEKTVAAEPLHTPAEQSLAAHLPDTDNLLDALESTAGARI
ncbi:MAG: restriction endonuclease subunit S [Betaproteobacteria bacterium HGW-Betaproteobacteria-1]|jgi:type I restriction enzyme S subunit|nr:MAG: restriction endonuclease subunit S [Betaproteobacteria bacterium HGW-Betaproteobacteria-1]